MLVVNRKPVGQLQTKHCDRPYVLFIIVISLQSQNIRHLIQLRCILTRRSCVLKINSRTWSYRGHTERSLITRLIALLRTTYIEIVSSNHDYMCKHLQNSIYPLIMPRITFFFIQNTLIIISHFLNKTVTSRIIFLESHCLQYEIWSTLCTRQNSLPK